MESTTPVLFPYEPELLWQKIRELLRIELENANARGASDVQYDVPGLTRKPIFKANEVCAMFHISRQTLHAWVKEGLIKSYKIKSRVFFLASDLEKLLKDGSITD